MSIHDLTIHERFTIQMEYVVPLIRDLQAILGADVVNGALDERIERNTAGAVEQSSAEPDLRAVASGTEPFAAGDALEYEVLAADEARFEMNVTRCAYREMMEQMGARDLGQRLICNLDFPMAARAGLHLERTQTCMQGASHCDFRYRKRT